MPPFSLFAVLLVSLSVASSLEFTTVYEWAFSAMDYSWPTEGDKTKALRDGSFMPQNVQPHFMAIYKERVFLSLNKDNGIPATLVSIPKRSASPAPPKLTPFPNWHFHARSSCDSIHYTTGLEIDRNGQLWVLDDGGLYCKPKLFIFDLNDGDKNTLAHPIEVTKSGYVDDLVIDQTPDNQQFAYITERNQEQLIVFSLKKNASWAFKTPGKKFHTVALSPREETKRLYLVEHFEDELYSISVSDLRTRDQASAIDFVGKWTGDPSKILIGRSGLLYASFLWANHISTWKTSEDFSEQRIYETVYTRDHRPFILGLDETETLWTIERNFTENMPTHKLRKATESVLH